MITYGIFSSRIIIILNKFVGTITIGCIARLRVCIVDQSKLDRSSFGNPDAPQGRQNVADIRQQAARGIEQSLLLLSDIHR